MNCFLTAQRGWCRNQNGARPSRPQRVRTRGTVWKSPGAPAELELLRPGRPRAGAFGNRLRCAKGQNQ